MPAGNDEARITNDERSTNAGMTKERSDTSSRNSDFLIRSTVDIRHSSFPKNLIATVAGVSELVAQVEPADRVAIDTEADSLHCYREKLCLLQISSGECDFIVDPLANVDLEPLRHALAEKEIVLHGADYDLRLLRRNLNFVPGEIFDTVIAARLIGIREFSLAALVKKYFGVELTKGSQKANWAQRPLPARMAEYAINDTHYLLPMAERLEAELDRHRRLEWFRQSCARALEQAAMIGCAISMKHGAFPARARCAAALPRSCANFGAGAKKKRKQLIARRFTFCKIQSCSSRRKTSLPAKFQITNTFLIGAGAHFVRQPSERCNCPNKIGQPAPFVRGAGQPRRLCDEATNCAASGIALRRIWTWSLPSLHRAQLWKQSPPTKRVRARCLFRGNNNCSGFQKPKISATTNPISCVTGRWTIQRTFRPDGSRRRNVTDTLSRRQIFSRLRC